MTELIDDAFFGRLHKYEGVYKYFNGTLQFSPDEKIKLAIEFDEELDDQENVKEAELTRTLVAMRETFERFREYEPILRAAVGEIRHRTYMEDCNEGEELTLEEFLSTIKLEVMCFRSERLDSIFYDYAGLLGSVSDIRLNDDFAPRNWNEL